MSLIPCTTKKKPVIVWLCDKDGWAFHNNSRMIAAELPQFEHKYVFYAIFPGALLWNIIKCNPDILVVNHPWQFPLLRGLPIPMVIRLACRAFRVWGEVVE